MWRGGGKRHCCLYSAGQSHRRCFLQFRTDSYTALGRWFKVKRNLRVDRTGRIEWMNEFNGIAANRLDYTILKYVNTIESNTIAAAICLLSVSLTTYTCIYKCVWNGTLGRKVHAGFTSVRYGEELTNHVTFRSNEISRCCYYDAECVNKRRSGVELSTLWGHPVALRCSNKNTGSDKSRPGYLIKCTLGAPLIHTGETERARWSKTGAWNTINEL